MLCLITKEITISTLAIAARPTSEYQRDLALNCDSVKRAQLFFALLAAMFIISVVGVATTPILTIGAGLVAATVTVVTAVRSVLAHA
ncbi:hypothetical protein BSZ39_07335 [Bowdeniella nasicola]|uniref:Uncharacterized protein n=1 Tax=Bowdeniella nasicola TaxID=208480 RepID=A0A1Q5Q264_9ACTO|nr:hypothetical protein [Bowdeniella nasicola]OKL53815.1 hypothetical protein BSZ39_07335 [Bowdeniella nasicola]